MKTTAFLLLVIVAPFIFRTSRAQEPQSHWLIGHWEGSLENYPANQNPARTLRVHNVAPDGKGLGRFAITGQTMGGADVKVTDSQVKIVVAGSKSVVELTREGDDTLVGTSLLASGQKYPIKLTKTKLPTEFDGEWDGHIPVLRGCGSSYYKITVKDSLITGSLQIAYSELGNSQYYDSVVTGEVNAAGTAVIEVRGPARSSSFSGTFTKAAFRASDPPAGNRGCAYEVELKRH